MTRPVDTRPLRRWLAAADGPAVLLACREHPDPRAWCAPDAQDEGPWAVYLLSGCLGDLPAAAVLEILAGGACEVAGLLDGCGAPDAARLVLEEAAGIALALGLDRQVTARSGAPGPADTPPDAPHRVLPRLSRRRAAPLLDAEQMPVTRRTVLAAPGAAEVGGLPAPEAHPALRMRSAVRELFGERPVPSALGDLPAGAGLLAAPGCGGTGTCVQACPVGALSLTVTDLTGGTAAPGEAAGAGRLVPGGDRHPPDVEQFVLSVDASRCIDCGLCVDLCPEGAMTRTDGLTWSQALDATPAVLRAGLVRRCARCGSAHRGEGELCVVCAPRARDPFGSRLPPGFRRPGR
ncbi:4Fe-4S dicluster domain-containing protein [Actinotalea sp.]|uniref:4Fe-4S dicluster domain-containing protein n=1 Tax=Actinotalea sp. TaxID=1872145 RepID=UPI0035626FCA